MILRIVLHITLALSHFGISTAQLDRVHVNLSFCNIIQRIYTTISLSSLTFAEDFIHHQFDLRPFTLRWFATSYHLHRVRALSAIDQSWNSRGMVDFLAIL